MMRKLTPEQVQWILHFKQTDADPVPRTTLTGWVEKGQLLAADLQETRDNLRKEQERTASLQLQVEALQRQLVEVQARPKERARAQKAPTVPDTPLEGAPLLPCRFEPGLETTVAAKLWLHQRLRKGAPCPCCNQKAGVYKRSLRPPMMSVLRIMHAHLRELGLAPDAWIEVPRLLREYKDRKDKKDKGVKYAAAGGDYAKLRFFNLLEADPTRSGFFRLTSHGHAFVEGTAKSPSHVVLYADEMIDPTLVPGVTPAYLRNPEIYIHEVKGRFKFEDLRELEEDASTEDDAPDEAEDEESTS
jgi:hypothetical protein